MRSVAGIKSKNEVEETDTELIAACISGDKLAQERLYRTYCKLVAANLYRVLGDSYDLDDLVQEVFVIAFRGLPKFRQEAKLSTWIYRIGVNVALGRIRTRARKPPPILKENPYSGVRAENTDNPECLLSREEERNKVYAVLDTIAPKKRIVLYLHEIQGHSLKEIAYIIGANPITIRTRLFYARKEFYHRIAEGGEV